MRLIHDLLFVHETRHARADLSDDGMGDTLVSGLTGRRGRALKAARLQRIVRAMTSTSTAIPITAVAMLTTSIGIAQLSGQQASAVLPGRLGEYVRQHVEQSPEIYKQLFSGAPVTRLLPADATNEVAVFGLIWIAAPASAYIAAVKDIERLERGPNFLVTKKISSPPRLEDFASLTLPAEDIEDLRTCKIGDCELKLGEDALRRFQREVDWTRPLPEVTSRVETQFRQMALEYVVRYQKAGDSALAAYRDNNRPTFVATEFKTMTDRMPLLTDYLPRLKTYLLEYPKASLPGAESFFYWQSAKFGLKPTIRINHVVTVETPDGAAVATKMLYANHYFWTAIELRVLVPDEARKGFWFASVSQSRSDGLTGYLGPIIRAKVRDEAQEGLEAALKAAKASLERP